MSGYKKMLIGSITLLSVTAAIYAAVSSNSVLQAQTTPANVRASGRFVAVQPPPAGDRTLGNFLWVVDSATGETVAYRIASVNAENGKVDYWMTERLVTEAEQLRLQKK